MRRRDLGALLFAVVFTFAVTHAYSQSGKESEAMRVWREADGIRHAVWNLDSGADPIAQELEECPNSDTIEMTECLSKAEASYQKVLDALPPSSHDSCGGTICGILAGYSRIAKIREKIAERSYDLGGGQE